MSTRLGRNRKPRQHRPNHLHHWDTYRSSIGEVTTHRCCCGAVVRLELERCVGHDHVHAEVVELGPHGVWPDQVVPLVQQFAMRDPGRGQCP